VGTEVKGGRAEAESWTEIQPKINDTSTEKKKLKTNGEMYSDGKRINSKTKEVDTVGKTSREERGGTIKEVQPTDRKKRATKGTKGAGRPDQIRRRGKEPLGGHTTQRRKNKGIQPRKKVSGQKCKPPRGPSETQQSKGFVDVKETGKKKSGGGSGAER